MTRQLLKPFRNKNFASEHLDSRQYTLNRDSLSKVVTDVKQSRRKVMTPNSSTETSQDRKKHGAVVSRENISSNTKKLGSNLLVL